MVLVELLWKGFLDVTGADMTEADMVNGLTRIRMLTEKFAEDGRAARAGAGI